MLKWTLGTIIPNHCLRCQENTYRTLPLCIACERTLPKYLSGFLYTPPISQWIIAMKFHKRWQYAKYLGALLAQHLHTTVSTTEYPDALIPVPLHKKRLQERGFNQALEICKPISKTLKIPIEETCIQRIKNTRPQSNLKPIEREHNVKKAFHVIKPIQAKHIALVDDVMTTGNTLNALSNTLQKIGVEKISLWPCARTHSF